MRGENTSQFSSLAAQLEAVMPIAKSSKGEAKDKGQAWRIVR
jgi:hypothetical protein